MSRKRSTARPTASDDSTTSITGATVETAHRPGETGGWAKNSSSEDSTGVLGAAGARVARWAPLGCGGIGGRTSSASGGALLASTGSVVTVIVTRGQSRDWSERPTTTGSWYASRA